MNYKKNDFEFMTSIRNGTEPYPASLSCKGRLLESMKKQKPIKTGNEPDKLIIIV
ncbi:hypothetical protein SMGES_11490 [Serratia marcescens]|nr:hypothetical protein SMGES_11490 [Serratia marcescens]